MFFPIRRAPSPRRGACWPTAGHSLFNVWDRIDENEFADAVGDALGQVFPDDPPRFMARTPHGYHDVAAIARDLAEVRLHPRRSKPSAAVSAESLARRRDRLCAERRRNEIEGATRSGLMLTDAVEAGNRATFGHGTVSTGCGARGQDQSMT